MARNKCTDIINLSLHGRTWGCSDLYLFAQRIHCTVTDVVEIATLRKKQKTLVHGSQLFIGKIDLKWSLIDKNEK